MATKRILRPRDPIQLGKLIVDIATGQVVDACRRWEGHGGGGVGSKGRRSTREKFDDEGESRGGQEGIQR